MYTYKEMDFKLWRIALLLKIHGYYYLPEGKKLFLDVSDILNKRYSTGSIENLDKKIEDIFNRYQAILLTDPPPPLFFVFLIFFFSFILITK